MQPPSPKDSRDVEQQQAWFDGLPEEARKAALRAELDKNLPVLASIMREVGVAGLCAWAAYLDVMESGNVDPFDMGEIIGAAVPTIKRSIEKDSAERLEEVERQREEERVRLNREVVAAEVKGEAVAEDAKRAEERAVEDRCGWKERAEKAEAALADRDRQVEQWLRDEARSLHEQATTFYAKDKASEADRLQGQANSLRFAANALANRLTQPSSNPPQQDREVGREAVDAAWEESGRSALDELFEAVAPRDGSMPDSFAGGMLASHAWAEVKRLRAAAEGRVGEDARLRAFEALTEGNFFRFTDPEHQGEYIWRVIDAVFACLDFTQPEADPEVPRCGGSRLRKFDQSEVPDDWAADLRELDEAIDRARVSAQRLHESLDADEQRRDR